MVQKQFEQKDYFFPLIAHASFLCWKPIYSNLICTCAYACVYTHVCVQNICVCETHTYICAYINKYVCIHVHTHTHTYVCVCVYA